VLPSMQAMFFLGNWPMLLAIDIGNTNTVFALCDAAGIRAHWRISTEHKRTGDEYAVWLLTLMQQSGFAKEQISQVAIASVVPDAIFNVKTLSRHTLGKEPLIISNATASIDMPIRIDNPRELGADRLVNAYAAWKKYQSALIIVDFGTATTFDVVSAKGEYVGGVIAPGVNLSLEALQRAAARLYGVAITHPEKIIGTNTTGAMQSGIYYGYLAMVDGINQRIAKEMGAAPKVVATGGLAPLYASASETIHAVDEDLTIEGIRLIAMAR
jgi:type III pantothenate kinase